GTADVKPKWTSIAHRGMSDQVASLDKRYPEHMKPIKDTDPKDQIWSVASRTYLGPGSVDLPEGFGPNLGLFIITDVKSNTAGTGDPTNEIRVQTGRPDDGSGGVWQRSYDFQENKWKPWIKVSFTTEDLQRHMTDPHAHSNILRYYRVYSVFGKFKDISTQITGDAPGGLVDDNSILLADNYGYSDIDPHDYLDAPYSGKFNISGILSFGGYSDKKGVKTTDGRWQLLLRKRNTKTGSDYTIVGHFTYQYKYDKNNKKYPTLLYEIKDVYLEDHQEVVMNISFTPDGSVPGKLIDDHPDLYLVPSRCHIVIEDNKTRAGSFIARAYRVLYGNLDVIGDVGVKSHHTFLDDPTSNIRVYGEKVQKVATKMTLHS
ncbi:MAG: hypothetical protein ACRCZ2_10430, partial [Fusobacteriaceae bacterium]